MRLSLEGSTGWSGSTYASRLPLPLVSRMSAVQPCDFASSWVSSNIFVFSQPVTSPPGLLNHNVLLASSVNIKCCVLKHKSIAVNFRVSGSYTEACLELLSSGKTSADGSVDPCRQNAGSDSARTVDAVQTRPFESIIKLCTLALLLQMGSFPQYGEGSSISCGAAKGVSASRTGIGTWLTELRVGSRTVM